MFIKSNQLKPQGPRVVGLWEGASGNLVPCSIQKVVRTDTGEVLTHIKFDSGAEFYSPEDLFPEDESAE